MSRIGLFKTINICRHFFQNKGFLETPTPPLVENPGMEAHLHPFKIKSVIKNKELPMYLHTSPEFYMKELLSEGFQKIFNIGWCFRDEPSSITHRNQFLMLEWYRAESNYNEILDDTKELILKTHQELKKDKFPTIPTLNFQKTTVQELFIKNLNFDILQFLDTNRIEQYIIDNFPDLLKEKPLVQWPWEDYFYLLFLNKIEPLFKKIPFLVVDEFPAPLAALSTIKPGNPKVCERFEVYLQGIEICNCFNELTDITIQKKRMRDEAEKKSKLYKYELPEPNTLYNALEKGLPPSAGIALGIERLYMGLMTNPEGTQAFFTPE